MGADKTSTLLPRLVELLTAAPPAGSPAVVPVQLLQPPCSPERFQRQLGWIAQAGAPAALARIRVPPPQGEIAADILGRRLAGQDLFLAGADGVWQLLLDNVSADEAAARAALLAEEIRCRMFAAGLDAAPIDVAATDAATGNAASANFYSTGPTADIAAGAVPSVVDALLARAKRELDAWERPAADARDAAARQRHESLAATLRHAGEVLAELAAARNQHVLAHTEAGRRPEPAGGEGSAPDLLLQLHGVIAQLQERAEADLREVPGHNDGAGQAPLSYRYLPMWHVASKAIGCYGGMAGLSLDGGFVSGRHILGDAAHTRHLAALDFAVLRRSIADLLEFGTRLKPSLLSIAVHHGTLLQRQVLQDYAALCDTIPEDRRQLVVWEILQPRTGLAQSELPQTVALLKRYGRVVFAQTDLDEARIDGFTRVGLYGLELDLAGRALPEQELMRRMTVFLARAEKAGLRAFIRGVPSLAVAASVICDGAEYLEGPPIAAPVEAPGGLLALDLRDLYRRAYPEARIGM